MISVKNIVKKYEKLAALLVNHGFKQSKYIICNCSVEITKLSFCYLGQWCISPDNQKSSPPEKQKTQKVNVLLDIFLILC